MELSHYKETGALDSHLIHTGLPMSDKYTLVMFVKHWGSLILQPSPT